MRKIVVFVLMAAMLLGTAAPPATAGKKKKSKPARLEVTATIAGSNPLGQFLFGVTEGEFVHVNECAEMPASQGLDGFIVELPKAFTMKGGDLEVLGSSPAPYDLAVYFYDLGCGLMNDYTINDGADEAGYIPPGAGWIVIDSLVGAEVEFSLTAVGGI